MKILIEVQCFNRKNITEICLNQINKYKSKDCDLRIINDYSTEYDNDWLSQFSSDIIMYEKKLNISKLKYRTFKNFLNSDYDYLYMCDNDIFHDKDFIYFLKKYMGNNLPITLYKSSFIHSFGDNVSKYLKIYENISLKTGLFGGASVFLNRKHVEKIVENLPKDENEWSDSCVNVAWDSKIQKMIDNRKYYLIPNESMCEHYGKDGLNHKKLTDDYALNPTEYLESMKDTILNSINISSF